MSAQRLLTVEEALKKLLDSLAETDIVNLAIEEANNSVLAKDFLAQVDFPAFETSSMDGFAIRFLDIQSASKINPVALKIIGDIPAGVFPREKIRSGTAMRIMTGAVLPDGADAVVPVEDTNIKERGPNFPLPEKITIERSINKHQFMRPIGQDFHKSESLLEKGHLLRPQDIALIAMNGIKNIPVFRKPRIALFSSGDELIPPGEKLSPGQIYDSNSFMLSSLIANTGAELFQLPIAPDNLASIVSILDRALDLQPDLILSTAGVSVGAHDYVRDALSTKGSLDSWRVNMRPGKPVAFGSYAEIPFIGLPGNPVSGYVTYELFARPSIYYMQGHNLQRNIIWGILEENIESDGRESYLRARFSKRKNDNYVRLTGHQGSGNLYSLVQANCLIKVPLGKKRINKGSEIEIWPLNY